MRLVVQRVKKASVSVAGNVVGSVDIGLFVLLGVGKDDKPEYADILAEKLVNMRIMADKEGKMNLSVKDIPAQAGVGAEVLVVSQFSLYADTSFGRRPSFVKAAETQLAKEVYEKFVERVKEQGVKVATGQFGAYMEIESTADGPVTIVLEYQGGK